MSLQTQPDDPNAVLDVDDLTHDQLQTVLTRATDLKERTRRGKPHRRLEGQTLAMLFQQPSTRTRVSFETGMTQLGGHALFLSPEDLQLGRGEPIRDTARALSLYADAVMVRMLNHEDILEFAEYATVPVVNGLTDAAHPCQTLADLLTVRELFGDLDVEMTWVGDGNNVCQSLITGAAMTDLDLTVATPPGHAPDDEVIERAAALGDAPALTTDPVAATAGADVVYTDAWVSMGEGAEREAKLAAFEGFQVTRELLPEGAAFMHCLPAHRGEEVTDAVLESEQSVVWQQAENRLHAQKGLLVELLAGESTPRLN